MNAGSVTRNPFNKIVIVAALGYFVDTYDLILFNSVRLPSLAGLGITGEAAVGNGFFLLNMQLTGMLIGGILWGIMGDRKGRISVLFGSIILYSVANILNGLVQNVEQYAILRLLAGIGLAGELGAGITLVSETMTKEHRGYGTMLVVSLGVLGAATAGAAGNWLPWRYAYFLGGGMGLLLLLLRFGVYESGMYKNTSARKVSKGNFFRLLYPVPRFLKYLNCISIGLPIWYVVGILLTFSPEIAAEMGVKEKITAGTVIMYFYLGASLGDFTSGYFSQVFKSRKKVTVVFMTLTGILSAVYLFSHGISKGMWYVLAGLLGIVTGYWAVFVTMASEQFGTNLRSTVTTSVPNFVRGAAVLITLGFTALRPSMGLVNSALLIGAVTFLLAFVSLRFLEETYAKDLDYVEE